MVQIGAKGEPPPVGVVALGASAGGLPALEAFIAQAPVSRGLCWVVVQHLNPMRETLLVRILQRVTQMPVREVSEGQPMCADAVYVIPPNATLTVDHRTFHVSEPLEPRGRRYPVDAMFRSLARAEGARGVAVVLSGSGSDGVQGLRAIHAAGGLTAAQDPPTAQFGGMPTAAIGAGCVDIVAPAAELPALILAALARREQAGTPWTADHPPAWCGAAASTGPGMSGTLAEITSGGESALGAEPLRSLTAILRRLQARSGYDLHLYKRGTLLRRIRRRMGLHRIDSLGAYEQLLARSEAELDLLAQEMLIGVTGFFRDRDAWHALQQGPLTEKLRAQEHGAVLRAWVAGCSTGEEAYTLAMVFQDATRALALKDACKLQIFATDINEDAIGHARRGWYPASIASEVSAERLRRYFVPHEGGWRVANEIREMVVFAVHDVNVDPPFTRLDLLCCRNLLIYLMAPLQRRLLPLFHYSLRAGGLLLLGSSETIGRFDDLFEALDARLRLYQRRPTSGNWPVPDFSLRPSLPVAESAKELPMSDPAAEKAGTFPALQELADRLLLHQWTPAAVLVNDRGDILYINGRTGRYLEPAAGKANWNVIAMARPGLRAALEEALRRAETLRAVVEVSDLPIESPDGPPVVDLSVQPLHDVPGLQGMTLIVFTEPGPKAPRRRPRSRSPHLKQLENELQQSREETQSLREEMRASQEELQAANEELQSTNEELQSTNEELTSSKEEMQSMNEELQAVNAQLQAKLDDLAVAQSDMRNLLNSTDIATLFLDKSLHVRRFTERARKVISLRDGDVGRPLSDLTSSLDYPSLEEDVRDMLRTLVVSEKQVRSREGHWYAVRILPYRTQDDVIDGAVITFVDVSLAKAEPAG